jgi:hypothetical protein
MRRCDIGWRRGRRHHCILRARGRSNGQQTKGRERDGARAKNHFHFELIPYAFHTEGWAQVPFKSVAKTSEMRTKCDFSGSRWNEIRVS